MTDRPEKPVVIPFPGPRPKKSAPGPMVRDLGLTALSQSLGPVEVSPRGHWCDRCEGIWYSYFAEARCPVCGGKC